MDKGGVINSLKLMVGEIFFFLVDLTLGQTVKLYDLTDEELENNKHRHLNMH